MENTKKKTPLKKVMVISGAGIALTYVTYKIIDYIQYRRLIKDFEESEEFMDDEDFEEVHDENKVQEIKEKKKVKKLPFSSRVNS